MKSKLARRSFGWRSNLSSSDFSAGDVLEGRFRLTEAMGDGATGQGFQAEDLETNRTVFLKVVGGKLKELAGRFLGEFRLVETLEVTALDTVGLERWLMPSFAGEDKDHFFFVRPFLEGESLPERLQRGEIREDEVRSILGDVALGLRAAHAENLIHRNLKPSNILLGKDGRAYLSGLGTGCFLLRSSRERLGLEKGGIRYLAPEQVSDARRVDRRTDLYVLGVILYEMLEGRPFRDEEALPDVLKALTQPGWPEPPRGDPTLAELALRLARFERDQRPSSADEVIQAVAPWLGRGPTGFDCEGCHQELTARDAFCKACGRSTNGPCPDCGHPLGIGSRFCSRCGFLAHLPLEGRLMGTTGGYAGHTLGLSEGKTFLGRSNECDLVFENKDQYVSRHQACLVSRQGCRWIQGGDWISGRPTTNGTMVNGRNVDGAPPVLLADEDRIRVGDSFFRYREVPA